MLLEGQRFNCFQELILSSKAQAVTILIKEPWMCQSYFFSSGKEQDFDVNLLVPTPCILLIRE